MLFDAAAINIVNLKSFYQQYPFFVKLIDLRKKVIVSYQRLLVSISAGFSTIWKTFKEKLKS